MRRNRRIGRRKRGLRLCQRCARRVELLAADGVAGEQGFAAGKAAARQVGAGTGMLRFGAHLLEAGPATPGEVASRIGLTSGSVTALIDRLESAGYVERRRSLADRRSVEIALTESRQAALHNLGERIESVIRDYYADKSAADVVDAGKALGMFAQALDQCIGDFGAVGDFGGANGAVGAVGAAGAAECGLKPR